MNLQTQIRQQQSTVQMLEKLFRANRCTQAEVDQAKRRLTDLEGQKDFNPLAPAEVDPSTGVLTQYVAPEPTGRKLDGDEYLSVQADLSKEADRLNRKMADLSNTLNQVPHAVSCPELTRPILEIKAQIETIWDKKRYLERNKCLPEELSTAGEITRDLPTVGEVDRFKIAYRKRQLIDLRSKLKRKLADPKAKPGKRVEWEIELTKADLEIQELELQLI